MESSWTDCEEMDKWREKLCFFKKLLIVLIVISVSAVFL